MIQSTHITAKEAKGQAKPITDQLSEEHLLATAKGGNSISFEFLCSPHMSRLHKTAFAITGNHEDAEDAVQDSLIRAFVRINDFRGASTFSTWLTRITINSALMIRRKNGRARFVFIDDVPESGEAKPTLELPHTGPDPEQTYVARERRTALRRAVSRLRPRVRAVVELGQFQECSMTETAKVLNISVAAAKGRLFHARAALRRSAALRAMVQSRTEPAA